MGTELSLDEKADWQDLQNKAVKRREALARQRQSERGRIPNAHAWQRTIGYADWTVLFGMELVTALSGAVRRIPLGLMTTT